ncbi:MAG: glycosyltransferase [Actinobacteria bacterium]|nr:glycosyltransferase [Actinomycetota bacterium]
MRSGQGVREFTELLESEKPDVVHIHNVYPLISPWVIRTAHKAGIPIVMTVHNFRLDCVAGTYLRDGKVCTDCTSTSFAMPAITHGCYRGSSIQSVPMVMSRSIHRSTWQLVDRFIALTGFHQEFLVRMGIAPDRIVVRPTSVTDPGAGTAPGKDVLFVGRLGAEGPPIEPLAWIQPSASTACRIQRTLLS